MRLISEFFVFTFCLKYAVSSILDAVHTCPANLPHISYPPSTLAVPAYKDYM
ncbi:hypothetical protein PEX1_028520 [Penicillium expansum]|nr:hypothetical protein PEXP_090420 [Penicillium expansum]KGO47091.1 hypothetical protein PEX1_028520 [Penicillium expansum]